MSINNLACILYHFFNECDIYDIQQQEFKKKKIPVVFFLSLLVFCISRLLSINDLVREGLKKISKDLYCPFS